GVDTVELWAEAPAEAAFTQVATDTTGSGSFSYSALAGDGSYAFYTVAVDRTGNREGTPSTADATTLLDTHAPASSASAPVVSSSSSISVSYSAADSGSGVDKVELWAEAPGETAFAKVATDTNGSGSFTYQAAGDGSYAFYTVAVDKAGNREDAPSAADTTTLVDTHAAGSSATSPAYSTSTSITVSYNASDSGSGVDKLELWAQTPSATGFTKVATDTTGGGSFTYEAAAGDGSYAFYTVAVDKAGNREDAPATADSTT